ncbi:aldo/keto reductase [Microlunatus spumicola]|uniref:Aldo/keto reductase n=1 Tax=Microlunatus spumicola TaxID=81499 RepID=A0ABP6WV48_9ACTN
MISTLPFGSTGHASTRVIFGAAALSEVTQDEADATLEVVRSHGLNHVDTAASYGEAELRLAPFLADHRDEVFLATKTGEREAEAAWVEINKSLERMGVDQVDLIQLHNLVDEAEWQQAYAPGGVLEAVVRARDEGLVRHIGVTGHGVTVARQHLRSLERFDFSSVLLPYNFPMSRNTAYLDDFEALVAECAQRGVAVQTIKAITKAPWSEGAEQHAATWYEPLKDPAAIETAVAWVLGRPDVFLNTVGDIHVLPTVLDAAEHVFANGAQRPDEDVMADLERQWGMAPLFV